jgi:hypothetical protein
MKLTTVIGVLKDWGECQKWVFFLTDQLLYCDWSHWSGLREKELGMVSGVLEDHVINCSCS